MLVLTSIRCSYNRTLLKDNNKYVRNQIKHLKKDSDIFLATPEQQSFKDDLFNYLRAYKQYNFFDGRENPVVLSPLIINGNKVIAFVAARGYDNAHEDVERVKFIQVPQQYNLRMLFNDNAKLYGFSGCNVFNASYS